MSSKEKCLETLHKTAMDLRNSDKQVAAFAIVIVLENDDVVFSYHSLRYMALVGALEDVKGEILAEKRRTG